MKYLVLFAALLAMACGDDQAPLSDGPLTGTIDGKSWTFMSGSAKPSSFEEGEYWFDLYGEELDDPCGFGAGAEGDSVLFTRPAELVDAQLSLSNNVTVLHGDFINSIMTEGRFVIDVITDTTIGGGLIVEGDHNLNGRWEVPICE